MPVNSREKIAFLYLPFLAITVLSGAGYSILNYLLLQRLTFIQESVTNLYLPGLLLSLLIVIFYKARLKVMSKLKNDYFKGYFFVAILSIPAWLIFQTAVVKLSVKKHSHFTYDQIRIENGINYYSLETPLTYDTLTTGLYPLYYTTPSNRGPGDSHYEVFLVTLMRSKNGSPLFWYGKKHEKVIRKDVSAIEQRDAIYQTTIKVSAYEFTQAASGRSIKSLQWNRRDDDYKYFQYAVDAARSEENRELPVLIEISETKSAQYWIRFAFIWFVAGQIIWLGACLSVKVDPRPYNRYQKMSLKKRILARRRDMLHTFAWLIPRPRYKATPIIININLLVFLVIILSGVNLIHPSGDDLIRYGSNFSELTKHGEVWRVFTAGFLHFGVFHLFMNMLALGLAGAQMETVLGTWRFCVLYVVSLVGSSLTSLFWNEHVNAAGASGAIFGIMGAGIFYAIFKIGELGNRQMFIITFIVFGLLSLIEGLLSWSNSDMAGHLGGMITGMVAATFFIQVVRKAGTIAI